jgi:hypothetical protein
MLPDGILIVDVNNDAWNDIVVGNGGSRDVSVFLNADSGGFAGQIPFKTPSTSAHLTSLVMSDSVLALIGTCPDAANISVLKLNRVDFSSISYILPTQGPVEIVSAGIEPASHSMSLIAIERDNSAKHYSIIKYEQHAPAQLTQKEITPKINLPLIAAHVLYADNDPYADIVFVCFDQGRHLETLYFASGAPVDRFENSRPILSFVAPALIPVDLWSAELNHDSRPDLIINFREPENRLTIALGREDTSLWKTDYSIENPVDITRRDNLQIIDVNCDGNVDLVCQNDLRKAIQLYAGRGDGTFMPPARLAPSEGLGSFTLGNLDRDPIPELIITDKLHGTLSIIALEER